MEILSANLVDWLVNENTEKQHSEDLLANLPLLSRPFADPKTDKLRLAFGMNGKLYTTNFSTVVTAIEILSHTCSASVLDAKMCTRTSISKEQNSHQMVFTIFATDLCVFCTKVDK